MTALDQVEWGACVLHPRHDRELERNLRRRAGMLPPLVSYFEACPWLAEALVELSEFEIRPVEIDFALADLIILVVSQDNSCRYCYATQRALLRAQGMSEARVRQLEEGLSAVEEPWRQALDFARRASRASPPPGEKDRARLRALGFNDQVIREIALAAAGSVFYNRVATIPALPVARIERISRHWLLGLLAPIAGRRIRSLQRRGTLETLPPELRSGPFAPLITRLDGLPAAAKLRRTLDSAFGSPFLSRRAKALVFAVVARGLGCRHSEREAAQVLSAEGLAPAEIEQTLTHLGSSGLDAQEALVVPFARETIRFEPIQVQRHAQQLSERLDTPTFVELVGVSALANALIRLWLALDAD